MPLPANIDEIMLEMDEADSEVGDGEGGCLADADPSSMGIAQNAEHHADDVPPPVPVVDDAAYLDVDLEEEIEEEVDVDGLNFDLDDLDEEGRPPLPRTRSGVIGDHRMPYREEQVR